MSILVGDPLTQLSFSVYENKGVFALLLGSGLSRAAEIPTGWEITLDLVRRVALAQGADEQPDWAAWYRKQAGEEPSYSALLEELASSPDERRSILHGYIEPTDQDREKGKKVPTKAHEAIAGLVRSGYVTIIVTTNFDRLLENALREVGVEPTVVASPDALAGAEPIAHSSCYILKLHGDYKDARILNTDAELSGYPPAYDALLDRIFDEYGLIVAGWSGEWDHALRAAFLRAPNRRYPVYFAMRGSIGDGAQGIIDQRHARAIEIKDADSFFGAMAQRVETLEQTHRRNPLSVDLLVNTTKRYLSKAEYRIQLEELFTEEVERLIDQTSEEEFTPGGGWSPDEFRARVARYESATEGLARIAGVLGRWGDGNEYGLMRETLSALYGDASRPLGGLTAYINARAYPTVLVFTAYGLGLVRTGRWDQLHQVLTAQLSPLQGEPQRVVETLFLWAWEGGGNDVWQSLDGLEKRKTALSDHLFDVFSDWGRSFCGVVPDFSMLFERFEILASLAYIESADEGELRQTLESNNLVGGAWLPAGRSGWHTQVRERLFQEIAASDLTGKLLEAGFSNGSKDFLDLSIAVYQRIARRG